MHATKRPELKSRDPKAEILLLFFFKQRNEPAGFPSASAVDSGDTGVHKEGGVEKRKRNTLVKYTQIPEKSAQV